MKLPTQEDVILWASAILFVALFYWVITILSDDETITIEQQKIGEKR